jgi:hydrogenase-4 membrane subunit HyfE
MKFQMVISGKADLRSLLRTAALNSLLLALMFGATTARNYAKDHWVWTVTGVFVIVVTLVEAFLFLQVSKNPKLAQRV